jgi:hypothetical protein
MASIALLLAYRDDDDWKEREEFDRDNFWWFKIGDKAYRIPKPFEIGALGTLAERSVELALSGMSADDGKRFLARLAAMVGQTFAMDPTPQLVKPLYELMANRSTFTGRSIESPGMERLSKEMRVGPGTSAFAQLAGKAGGLSPVQIDHLINGYFGWLGSHLVMAADFLTRPAMGLPERAAMRAEDVFVLGAFIKDLPQNQSRYVTQFYEQAEAVRQTMGDIKHLMQLGEIDKAKTLMTEKQDQVQLAKLYAGMEKRIGEINKRIRYTQMRELDPETKREEIDKLYRLRNEMARQTEEHRAMLRQ